MGLQTVRVFLGNLPPGVTEGDVERKVQKYALVTSVELKQRDTGAFAFIDISDTRTKVEHCFEKLSSTSWKGYQLRVQKAKESFLDRLAKERKENEILPVNHNTSESLQKGNKEKSSMSSYSDTAVKGSLHMFGGTRAIFGDIREKVGSSKITPCDLIKSKLEEEKRILQKFETSHSVWRDSNDEYVPSPKRSKRVSDVNIALKNMKLEDHIPNVECTVRSSISHATENNECSINGNKGVEAEMRRLKAMDERQKELLERRKAVKFSLSSIHTKSNKKIVFDSDEDEVDLQKSIHDTVNNKKSKNEGKLPLFNEDEMVDTTVNNEYDDDFRIRNQFEGRKGQKLLKLQAKYGNDKRFTLDERFIESDDEKELVSQDNLKCKREKMLEVLGGGIERDLKPTDTTIMKHIAKPMLRYDPMKPAHTQFEVKSDAGVRIKNKKCDKNIQPNSQSAEDDFSAVSSNNKVIEETLPVVSKERFYHVTDTLRESLKNRGQPFSLLEMFGDEVQEKGDDNESFHATPIQEKSKLYVKPFNDESSSSEEENDTQAKEDSTYNNYGISQDNFFFESDDIRFLEGSLFFRKYNRKFVEEFSERRDELKEIVRRKIGKNRRRAAAWSTKLGGTKRKSTSKRGA